MDNIEVSLGDNIVIGEDNGIVIDDQNNYVSSDSVLVGPPGPEGPPGFSPIANVTQKDNGATITITDKTGTTSANVYNGTPGVSPNATVTSTATGATISITDANGTTSANITNGSDGQDGESASISVGTTTTLAPGSSATVENVGTSSDSILNFGIPAGVQGIQGIQGVPGQDGISPIAYVTQTATGADITVEDSSGTTSASIINGTDGTDGADGFSPIATVTQNTGSATISITDQNGTTTATVYDGQDGSQGQPGQSATIAVGTTTTGNPGTNASVTNSGTSSSAVFDFVIPRGADGSDGRDGTDGQSATITVGNTTTGNPGTNASVTNSGTSSSAIFDFVIPRGVDGQNGSDGRDGVDGQSATIAVGTTTTGNPGTNASVTNSGTSSSAVFDFVIPRGADGQNGSDGSDGFSPVATVTQNTGSATISITDKNGTTTATVYDGSDAPVPNNGTLTIQKNGTTVQTFTANQSSNATANITVPTKTSDLTNDSSFVVASNYAFTATTDGNGFAVVPNSVVKPSTGYIIGARCKNRLVFTTVCNDTQSSGRYTIQCDAWDHNHISNTSMNLEILYVLIA